MTIWTYKLDGFSNNQADVKMALTKAVAIQQPIGFHGPQHEDIHQL